MISTNAGNDMKLDKKEVAKLERRFKIGDLEAGHQIGKHLIRSRDKSSLSRGIKLLTKVAIKGVYEAAYNLAFFYEEDWNPKKSNKLAFKWFKFAAENGIVGACNQVAVYLEGGVYVQKDLKSAIAWYLQGARLGDVLAQANLAENYEKGIGVKKNFKLALKWYEASMLQGFDEAEENYHRVKKLIRKGK